MVGKLFILLFYISVFALEIGLIAFTSLMGVEIITNISNGFLSILQVIVFVCGILLSIIFGYAINKTIEGC